MKLIENILRPAALTTLRVVVGVIMLTHGWQKLSDMQSWIGTVDGYGIPAPEVMAWLSMAAEFLGGILLLLGLLTPLAGIAIFANLMVAIFVVHRGHGLLAAEGGWELPLALGLVALYFVFRGSGPLGLDALLFRRRAETRRHRELAREQRRHERRPKEPGRPMKPAEIAG
jgi:putative oxidoreductase